MDEEEEGSLGLEATLYLLRYARITNHPESRESVSNGSAVGAAVSLLLRELIAYLFV